MVVVVVVVVEVVSLLKREWLAISNRTLNITIHFRVTFLTLYANAFPRSLSTGSSYGNILILKARVQEA